MSSFPRKLNLNTVHTLIVFLLLLLLLHHTFFLLWFFFFFFLLCNTSSCFHKWRLAPWHFFVTAVLSSPFGKGLLGAHNLPSLQGQTNKCRYDAEENCTLLQRRRRMPSRLHAIHAVPGSIISNFQNQLK